jgi:hypothetical protein
LKVPVSAIGQAVVVNPENPADLEVSFFGAKGKGQVNYRVLDTGILLAQTWYFSS